MRGLRGTSLGDVVRSRRRELGLTLQRVGEFVGCTKGYLSLLETGQRNVSPSTEILEKLERALRLDAGALRDVAQWERAPEAMRRKVRDLESQRRAAWRLAELLKRQGVDHVHRSGELRRLVEALSGDGDVGGRGGAAGAVGGGERAGSGGDRSVAEPWVLPVQVPVINKVCAGYPTEFTDMGYPARVADEYVSVPDVYDADAFAARVIGDSMEPVYREGDIVVFSPSAATVSGSDCFVRFEGRGESTFKRVFFEEAEGVDCSDGAGEVRGPGGAGAQIRLQPLNPRYPPRIVEREEVGGMFAAVYVVRPVGK